MNKSASDSASATVHRGRDLIRPAAFVIALSILVTATLWMHFQPGVPDPLRPVDRFSRQWWLYPIEQNGFMRLPLVSGEPNKLFMLPNSRHAWVGAGEHSAVLLHTADGGDTWESITVSAAPPRRRIARAAWLELVSSAYAYIPPAPQKSSGGVEIVDFFFADPSHGWVLDYNGQILETHDGGKSWTSQRLQGSPYFMLAATGSRLVAGGYGMISSSTDGGKQWLAFPIAKDVAVSALYIAPGGAAWAGTEAGEVWSSQTGNSRWVRAGASGANPINGIFFVGPLGFAENGFGVAETQDGGRSWKPFGPRVQDPVLLSAIFKSAHALKGADSVSFRRGLAVLVNSHGFRDLEPLLLQGHDIVVAAHGQILATDDDVSFRHVTMPYGFARAVHADANGERIWTAGFAGILLNSTDGGATWKLIQEDEAQDFRAISFTPNGTRGWAVGNHGAVVLTENGGRTWKHVTRANRDRPTDFDAVISSDDGMHVKAAVQSSADALESFDGGSTWKTAPITPMVFSNTGFFTAVDDQWTTISHSANSEFLRFGPAFPGPWPTIPTRVSSIAASGENGWVRDRSFPNYRSVDGGRTWQPTNVPQDVAISDVRFLDANHGFAQTEDGKKFETNNGGTSWQAILNDASSWSVGPLIANKDGKRMWTASIDGVPLRSLDGGKTWLAPQYDRFPAPWYYVALAPVLLLLFVSMRKPAPVIRAEHSIEDVPWNDRPLTEPDADRLDYQPLAAGIARFFGNRGTEPPLTIAITGKWGSGKSSLMNLVAEAVKRYDYRPVWFNAWHYQSEEFLLPAVLESLRTEAVPRFWTLHGLQFRMRLLVLRGMKNWLPALVIMAVLVTTAAYFMRDQDAFRQLVENFRNLGTEKSDKFFQSAGLLISSLLSVIIVFRSLNAFGVSGTKVAALLSGSVRLADAGGQTGFRHRFARAFGEVTRALGRNRLVLFIDDLDRCRPDHVLSVLECINFLVTSGDCFIVAGIDRPRVERCVAMRFEEESKAIGDDENADGENDPATAVRYAQKYLEKLINIEVPVPLAPPTRSRELFAGDRKEAREERVRATVFGERLITFGQSAIPWVVAAAVLAGAMYLGYALLPDRYPQQRPAQTIVVTAPAAAPKSPVASAPAGTPAQPSPEKQPTLQLPTRFVQPIIPNRPEVLPIIGIVLIVICGIVRLSIERAKLEQDSNDFRTALRQWHPLLYEAEETPRSMKRCVNRVRYYAMRQRTNPLPPTLPERLVRLVQRLRRVGPLQDDVPLAIPENILVPVSVVQHVYPEWLKDDAFWSGPAAYIEARQPLPDLAEGIAALRKQGSIEKYRPDFTHISAGIQLAGAANVHTATA